MAKPSKGIPPMNFALALRRSSNAPPWTTPYIFWLDRLASSERSAHLCVRSMAARVYPRPWSGEVGSSKATMMSAPNCSWMRTEVSASRYDSSSPSPSGWKYTPASVTRPEPLFFQKSQTEHLESSGIGHHRTGPLHVPMQAGILRKAFFPQRAPKMGGVRDDELGLGQGQVLRLQTAHFRVRAHDDVSGRLHRAVLRP